MPFADSSSLNLGKILAFLTVNIILAFAAKQNIVLSTLYAYGTFGLALVWLLDGRKPERVVYMMAYITGAELVWRGTEAAIFYESGKYVVAALAASSLLRRDRFNRASKLPLLYFVLLLPSLGILPSFDRQYIAFNLSGPFALAAATMFFSTVALNREQIKRVLLAMLAPTVGLAFIALFYTLAAESISFGGYGSGMTSAGIGENQVSSALSFGAAACFYYLMIENRQRGVRALMGLLTIWLLAHSMLTFSRGGFYNTIGAMAIAAPFLMRSPRSRATFVVSSLFIFLIGYFILFPAMDRLTRGGLSDRFGDTEATGRVEIVKADLLIFQQHPILGVGPGQSLIYHAILFRRAGAHTEYSRLLAEHGSFGLISLLILLGMSAQRFLEKTDHEQKSFRVFLTAWALLYMIHSAMRLVAPAFTFGLAAATLELKTEATEAPDTENVSTWNIAGYK